MELSQRRERLLGRLRQRKSRVKERRVLVEGVRAVAEALNAEAALAFAVLSPRLSSSVLGADLEERLASADVVTVSDEELEDLADTDRPQGVLAVFEEPGHRLSELPSRGRVLLLDAVQDPGNVGTLVRSAVAFGLDAVLCLDGTVDPWSTKAVRGSAGMVFRLPVIGCGHGEALAVLEEKEIPIRVASGEGAPVVAGAEAFGLVLGNEGAGVREEIRAAARAVVGIPMKGPAESLNVGIAGSILMHALTREDT
jgi:TrmH family RNA methyltransferase